MYCWVQIHLMCSIIHLRKGPNHHCNKLVIEVSDQQSLENKPWDTEKVTIIAKPSWQFFFLSWQLIHIFLSHPKLTILMSSTIWEKISSYPLDFSIRHLLNFFVFFWPSFYQATVIPNSFEVVVSIIPLIAIAGSKRQFSSLDSLLIPWSCGYFQILCQTGSLRRKHLVYSPLFLQNW